MTSLLRHLRSTANFLASALAGGVAALGLTDDITTWRLAENHARAPRMAGDEATPHERHEPASPTSTPPCAPVLLTATTGESIGRAVTSLVLLTLLVPVLLWLAHHRGTPAPRRRAVSAQPAPSVDRSR